MTEWKTEVRRDSSVFRDLAEWWDAQPIASVNPFLNSHIVSCWEPGYDEPKSRLHVRLLHRRGELVAALPFYRSGGRLRTLSRAHSYSLDVVTVDDEEVRAYLPRWMDQVPIAHLYRFQGDSPLVAAAAAKTRWTVAGTLRCPYVDLTRGIDAIEAGMSRGLAAGLRKQRRRLEKMGEVTFVDHPASSEVDSVLEEGLRLEASGWKGREGVATLNDPTVERWHRSVAEVAQDRGWLRLSSLYLDGRMIAFSYDLEYGRRRFGLKTSYDETPEMARCSPGSLLFESILKLVAGSGLESFEMSFAGRSWKNKWTSDERTIYDLLIFGSGPIGRTLAGARKLKR